MFFRLLIFVFSSFFFLSNYTKVNYQICDNSKLFLKGKTNITDFTCNCEEKFTVASLEAEINHTNKQISFQNASLFIKTATLDCNNYLINKDLQKTLKIDKFPCICVELQHAEPTEHDKTPVVGKPCHYQAKTIISIAGVSKPQIINVLLTKIANNKYKMIASKDISMAEYEIKPFSPIRLIKFNDSVAINLELYVEVH